MVLIRCVIRNSSLTGLQRRHSGERLQSVKTLHTQQKFPTSQTNFTFVQPAIERNRFQRLRRLENVGKSDSRRPFAESVTSLSDFPNRSLPEFPKNSGTLTVVTASETRRINPSAQPARCPSAMHLIKQSKTLTADYPVQPIRLVLPQERLVPAPLLSRADHPEWRPDPCSKAHFRSGVPPSNRQKTGRHRPPGRG